MGTTSNLILGGSGLIGLELQSQLKKLGEDVINLDLKDGFDLRKLSLAEFSNVDYVWFLAWDSGGAKYLSNEKNFLDIYRNNVQICQNVFSFIENFRKPFLFTSSQLAATDNPYGFTKLLGENYARLLGGKVVRMWNVYGWEKPGERSHVIPDLMLQGILNKKIKLLSSGEERRQFIYVEDCVKNLLKIRESDENEFSLTNNKWMKISEVAESLGKLLNLPVELGTEKGYENLLEPNPSWTKFKFDVSLDEGLKRILISANTFISSL